MLQNLEYTQTYLVVQWLILCASDAGDVGSVPGQRTKIDSTCRAMQPKRGGKIMSIHMWMYKNTSWNLIHNNKNLKTLNKKWNAYNLKTKTGTSPVVQWLTLCTSLQGVKIPSVVRELTSHMPCSMTKNKLINKKGDRSPYTVIWKDVQ